ncbi:hypothetical protein RB653_001711 [Dictyostelium firmibasis]|uniref:tRNA pseudouridine synthase n=1 Tax=Dictyostelium firmibasis TaxID=79012 RepID=A0AAN7YRK7_9MYCE
MSPRYKIIYEYTGKSFTGFQKLKYPLVKLPVQQVLENSLEKIHGYKIPVVGSSRTDHGVSAVGQVSHFDIKTRASRGGKEMPLLTPEELTMAINYNVGKEYENSIRIIKTEIVDDRFHCRFNATSRTYLYRVMGNCGKKQIPLELQGKVLPVPPILNLDIMRKASEIFIGTHDFSSFRSAKCSSTKPIRSISHIKIFNLPLPEIFRYNPSFQPISRANTRYPIGNIKNDDDVIDETTGLQYFGIEIKARAFLHNQVRIMVASLLKVGEGVISIEQLEEIKQKKDRSAAPSTIAPEPLTLLTVSYDDPKVQPPQPK